MDYSDNLSFSHQTNFQLEILLSTTSVILLSYFILGIKSARVYLNILSSFCFTWNIFTITSCLCLILKINSSGSGYVLHPDNLPYWLNTWWVFSELLFCFNVFLFIIYVYCKIVENDSRSTPTTVCNDSTNLFVVPIVFSKKIYVFNLILLLFTLIQCIFFFLLMFFMCNPEDC